MSDSNCDGPTEGERVSTAATLRKRWSPAGAFAVIVLVASVVPVPEAGGGGVVAVSVSPTDPFHLVGYAVLAALVARVTGRGGRGLVVAAAVAVGFGFGVELLQIGIPWRTFAWRDSFVNAIGATGGTLVVSARAGRAAPEDPPP
ncbi:MULTISPECIES: VanZ family protein [Haloferacaceae]|uniref:VanZ family protein n=1 Tax=Halorubrum glutamatedens TaxID=2707018 RepID=A0ABD5QSB6_9EURY|nr:VanZ family protein [Halobellus captivus]